MDVLKLIGSKGTKEILETLEDEECTWTDVVNACKDAVSLRIFNVRLKQLEEMKLIDTKAVLNKRKATKLYFLTEKGKTLLKLIHEAEKY